MKKGGGRRYYRPGDIRLLCGIRTLLYDDGLSIREVQARLREGGVASVAEAATAGAMASEKPGPARRRRAPEPQDQPEDVSRTALSSALEQLLEARERLDQALQKD